MKSCFGIGSISRVGNIVTFTDQTGDGDMKTCTYDPLYRLLSATGTERGRWQDTIPWKEWDATAPNNVNRDYLEEYEYDKVGFMTSLSHRATDNSYQYTRSFASSSANHLASMTSGSNTFSFSYDESGNLTSGNGNHYYEWDYRNQLQRFYVAASGSGVRSVDAYYLYDNMGNRTKKFVLNQARTEVDVTVYIGLLEIRYKKAITSGIVDGSYQIGSFTIKLEANGQCIFTNQFGDHPDEFNVDYFTYSDHLGSSTLLIRSNGEIISREFYTPFGETAYRTSPKSRYRYCGKEKDGESGLYYYGARYYAAWLCRFVSVDPLAEKYAQLSSYNYADNSPVTDLDVDGLQSTDTQPSSTPVSSSVTIGFDNRGRLLFDLAIVAGISYQGVPNLSVGTNLAVSLYKGGVGSNIDGGSSKWQFDACLNPNITIGYGKTDIAQTIQTMHNQIKSSLVENFDYSLSFGANLIGNLSGRSQASGGVNINVDKFSFGMYNDMFAGLFGTKNLVGKDRFWTGGGFLS